MARIKAKQILEFQDLGSGQTGQYPAWNSSTGKFELLNQPLDGEKGEAGVDGAAGTPGVNGDKGSTGAKGQKGEAGAKGQKGEIGVTGDKGATGAKGQKGEIGVTGDKGNTGDKGATGAKGQKGEIGVTGDKGATGAKGEKGTTGAKGQKGEIGVTGDKGNTGDKGVRGDDWTSGTGDPVPSQSDQTGDHYLDLATGTVWYYNGTGWEAPGNITGPKGTTGEKGEKGKQGATGTTGTTGGEGDKGDKGQKGEIGPGFTSISNAANNRILTAVTSNSANAESTITYDSSLARWTGSVSRTSWSISDYWGVSSSVLQGNGAYWRFYGYNTTPYNQAAMMVNPAGMVTDVQMGAPTPMVWDQVNGAIGFQGSSLRFKDNVQDLEVDLEGFFEHVRPVSYTGKENDLVQVGFIAEEVEQWDSRFVIHDENGDPFSLDYGRFVPVLLEAIKDLRNRIQQLEQNNKLK